MTVDAAPSRLPLNHAPRSHPVARLILRRLGFGVLTLVLVSILVFAATEVLPGNAARAILGRNASPEELHSLEVQLHLNQAVTTEYLRWISNTIQGHFGNSLANGSSVTSIVGPRLLNSAVLVLLAGAIGTALGLTLGVLAAARRDGWFDGATSVFALILSAIPEYVVALVLIIVFSTVLLHVLPGVSIFSAGSPPWDHASALVLPVATLVVLIFPYIFRMTRATMIEALTSEYCEMAELTGIRRRRVLFRHALVNVVPALVQVIALNLLYLAGGIVVVEYVFNYQGLGQGLISAVAARDIPVIQCIVLVLAAFYVIVNISSDAIALIATPRRRLPRSG